MIRYPAVAGHFYPGHPETLRETLQGFIQSQADRVRAVGIVVPHAGYVYSGHVAGAVYSRVALPSRAIALCPNHTGLGPPMSIMASGAWQTPLGTVEIDTELSATLMATVPALRDDVLAHRYEHALEVQLPFLQYLAGESVLRFVPITLGTKAYESLETLGVAIAQLIQKTSGDVLVVASSDMNHYEPDPLTRVKDRKAIERVVALDPEGLYNTVERENISMCGYGSAVVMLTAARILGACHAELVKYATSGDVSGDFDRVVGYAGMMAY